MSVQQFMSIHLRYLINIDACRQKNMNIELLFNMNAISLYSTTLKKKRKIVETHLSFDLNQLSIIGRVNSA